MVLYLSGNFPQLMDPKKEEAFRNELHEKGKPYHRLVTFYYPRHCETVFSLLRAKKRKLLLLKAKNPVVQNEETASETNEKEKSISVEAQKEVVMEIIKPVAKRTVQTNLF